MKNNTCIVIPVADLKGTTSKQQLEKLLESIKDYQRFDIIICFDSCSPEFIRYFEERYDFESVINTGNRLHFARNSNQGISLAMERKQSVLLVNQDCVLPPEKEVQDSMCQFVGICNPKCTNQLPIPKGSGEINEVQTKFPFYCTFIHQTVLEKVGLLDGIFSKSSCEDDEYLIRAKLAGFKLYVADIYVYHEGSYVAPLPGWESPSGAYNAETIMINLNKLYTKYQVDPGIPHEELMNFVLTNRTWKDSMYIAPRR